QHFYPLVCKITTFFWESQVKSEEIFFKIAIFKRFLDKCSVSNTIKFFFNILYYIYLESYYNRMDYIVKKM
ncbi:MAG: hypothetical protein JXA68_05600, partial [Ignavibacteriales bacterium]|nr:hypothetical protein [Ignavibacteriales bacterium]